MSGIFRTMLLEFAIILALWLGGWAIFGAGVWGLKVQKERYWTSTMAVNSAYRILSVQEKEAARTQFMALWAVKPGDAPFVEGGWKIHVAYGAQAVGSWLRHFWLVLYVLIVLVRLGVRLRTGRKGPAMTSPGISDRVKEEARIACLFLVCAVVWYLVWVFLAPSLYVSYQRFFAKSYAYLWNTRFADFQFLAKGWFVIILFYPLTAGIRAWRALTASGKAR